MLVDIGIDRGLFRGTFVDGFLIEGAKMETEFLRTIEFLRTVRTPHSERFILRARGADIAAIDIHFRTNGIADATVVVFEESGISDNEIPSLLSRIDEVILPDVSMGERNLSFTVVVGRVLGAYQPDRSNEPV